MKRIVAESEAGLRLDTWLSRQDVVPSRSRASELIARGLVRHQGRALRASVKVRTGWEIEVDLPPPAPTVLQPLDRPLDILHEDEDLVVVDKPSGLVVHPAAGHAQDTLVNVLLHHVGNLAMGFGENRPGIVHRLDRDTSGILVVAKNDFAHARLAEQFRLKTAHRIYHCLVHGTLRPMKDTVRTELGRHPRDRKRFASVEAGKSAVTHYEVLNTTGSASLVRCRLETGRTHQIRVHLSERGAPILGDEIYGRGRALDREVGRLALHARELGFIHPRDARPMSFTRDWPDRLAEFAREKGLA